jgi:hypothetical protein
MSSIMASPGTVVKKQPGPDPGSQGHCLEEQFRVSQESDKSGDISAPKPGEIKKA